MAVVAALALALVLAACGDDDKAADTTGGGGGGPTLNVTYVTAAAHPYGIAVQGFADNVNATGALTIVPQPLYPQAESQLLDDVRSGVVDAATISSAIWDGAGINAFQALQAPFLITDYGLSGAVLSGPIGKAMIAKGTEESGDLVVLAIHEGGLRKPLGIKPLVTPADYRSKTIRAPQSKVLAAGLRALGANVEPVPLPEVYPALQSGTVDGVEANLPLIYTQKWYEVAKNITGNVNLWPFPTVLAVNKAKYDSLTADQQQALTDAAATIATESIAIFTTPGSTVAQDLVNCGAKFLLASDADKAALAKAGQAAIAELAPESQDFAAQIQTLKDAQPPGTPPPPFPTEKTGDCVPPPG